MGRGWVGGGEGLGKGDGGGGCIRRNPITLILPPESIEAVQTRTKTSESEMVFVCSLVEVLLYVHRNHKAY